MKVLRSHITSTEKNFEFSIRDVDLDIPELVSPASALVTAYSVGENYFCHGYVEGKLSLRCDICLEDYDLPVHHSFDLYVKCGENEEGPEQSEEVDVMQIGKNDIQIDFSDFFKDLFLLEIPIQKRCRPECKGLCTICGANQNYEQCQHEDDRIDPRWAALNELKKNLN